MKPVLTSLLFLLTISGAAQQSTLHGTVAVFNSQFETGVRQYVFNAAVEEDFGKSQATTTDAKGNFLLSLLGIKEQEKVSYSVRKEAFEVVNIEALQAVAGQKESVKVYMAPEGKIAENKLAYYKINREAAERVLSEQLKAVEKQILGLQSDQTINAEKIKSLQAVHSNLLVDFGQIDKMARELAERYARTNLDDQSPVYQQAFRYFQKGRLDSTLVLLEQADLEKTVRSIISEQARLIDLGDEFQLRASALRTSKQQSILSLRFKANLHYLRYEIPETEKSYRLLLLLDNTDPDILSDYAAFLSKQNKIDVAIEVYEKLRRLNSDPDQRININLSLAQLYTKKKNFEDAEAMCGEASALNKTYFKMNRVLYRQHEANVMMHTGDIYLAQTRQAMAEFYFKQADIEQAEYLFQQVLPIYEYCARLDIASFGQQYAICLYLVGELYIHKQDFILAEKTLQQSALVLDKSTEKSAAGFTIVSGNINHNFAKLYIARKEYVRAEALLDSVLASKRQLSIINPEEFSVEIATVLNTLCQLYCLKQDYVNAEKQMAEAMKIWHRLGKEKLYIGRLELITALKQKKMLFLEWVNTNPSGAIKGFRRFYKTLPKIKKRLSKAYSLALMVNALQANRKDPERPLAKKFNQDETWLYLNVAHAYLLNGKTGKAIALYQAVKNRVSTNRYSFGQQGLDDLDAFEKAGIKHRDFSTIRKLLLD